MRQHRTLQRFKQEHVKSVRELLLKHGSYVERPVLCTPGQGHAWRGKGEEPVGGAHPQQGECTPRRDLALDQLVAADTAPFTGRPVNALG